MVALMVDQAESIDGERGHEAVPVGQTVVGVEYGQCIPRLDVVGEEVPHHVAVL